ncbi:MAG: ABC transporter permease, partial [Betaproteobacteria bacterium]|nr:ABC transporter permease [Betaproteobacteria bacterium]
MFRKIAAFELRYQLKAPVFWVSLAAFFLLTFGATTIPQIQIGSKGNTFINAPFAIVQVTAIMSIFAMFIVTAFVANVVVRDDETGFGPIIRATGVTKFDYLFGRFLGAWLATMLILAAVPLGILAGSAMPWLDTFKVGPFRPADYLYAYLCVGAPTVLLFAAIFFALATATRSMMATYLGVVAFLILYVAMRQLFKQPQYDHIVALLEPFGIAAIGEVTKYWTGAERNTMLPPLFGIVAENRLVWVGISLLFLALAYRLFGFQSRGAKHERAARTSGSPLVGPAGPLPVPRFDGRS